MTIHRRRPPATAATTNRRDIDALLRRTRNIGGQTRPEPERDIVIAPLGLEVLPRAVAYWKANAYSGASPLVDGAGNGHDMTVTGATFSTDHFELDGINDSLDVADHADLDFGATDDFSIVVVASLTAAETSLPILEKVAAGTVSGYRMFANIVGVGPGSSLFMQILDAANAASTAPYGASPNLPTTGQVYAMAFTREAAGARLHGYRDGYRKQVDDDSSAVTGSLANSSTLYIGRNQAGTNFGALHFYGAAIFRERLIDYEIASAGRELIT